MCRDQIECLTAGVAMFSAVLAEADALAASTTVQCANPLDELREGLPLALARFSPDARAILRDTQAHCISLVAGLHEALRT